MQLVMIYIAVQMVNVIISTIKSIKTVNGSALSASVWNAVSYTVSTVVVKMLVDFDFSIVIAVSLLTNLVGVYVAKWFMDKQKKERLWTISTTIFSNDQSCIEDKLKNHNIKYTMMPAFNDRILVNIFSYSRGESGLIFEILKGHKYTVTENVKN